MRRTFVLVCCNGMLTITLIAYAHFVALPSLKKAILLEIASQNLLLPHALADEIQTAIQQNLSDLTDVLENLEDIESTKAKASPHSKIPWDWLAGTAFVLVTTQSIRANVDTVGYGPFPYLP